MSDYSLKNGKQVTIPLKGADQFGNPIAIPPGFEVTSADSSIATAVAGPDGQSVVISSVSAGDVVISVASGNVTAHISITIEAVIVVNPPVLSTITFDLANVVEADLPVAASPISGSSSSSDASSVGAGAAPADPGTAGGAPTDGTASTATASGDPAAPSA